MLLYLEENDHPLKISLISLEKISLAKKAMEIASAEFQISKSSTQLFAHTANANFYMEENGVHYRCIVQYFSGQNSDYTMVAMQILEEETSYLFNMAVIFIVITLMALLLNALASFIISGKAIKPAVKSAKDQEEFVLKAGHELRTPLAILEAGFSAIALAPEKSSEYLPIMNLKTRQMGLMITELMLLFSNKNPQWKITKSEFEIDTFLLEYIELEQPLAKERHISLGFEMKDKIFVTILADKERLRQVLDILLSNAYHYAPCHSTITFSLHQDEKNSILSVSDLGRGLSDSDKLKVFHKFYRVDGKDISGEHFGLGLSIAKEIITLHKGSLSINDNVPNGCIFVITLPNT